MIQRFVVTQSESSIKFYVNNIDYCVALSSIEEAYMVCNMINSLLDEVDK